MNKGELVDVVASDLSTSKAEAGRVIDAVIGAITKGVAEDDRVAIAGFGTFTKKQRAARTGINPATGERIQIKAGTTCGFKPSDALKAAI